MMVSVTANMQDLAARQILSTQSLSEQCGQSQREWVSNELYTQIHGTSTSPKLLLQAVCKIRRTFAAAWSLVFKLMLIKCTYCRVFNPFLPLLCPFVFPHLSPRVCSKHPRHHNLMTKKLPGVLFRISAYSCTIVS